MRQQVIASTMRTNLNRDSRNIGRRLVLSGATRLCFLETSADLGIDRILSLAGNEREASYTQIDS